MSRKRDLIEKVRYPNPIPLPPFPPKLVQLSNPSSDYAHPSFSDRLANAHPIPTVVDAQAGMNINLLDFQGVWNGQGSRNGHADPSVAPTSSPTLDPTLLDPEDAYLLSDLSSTLPSATSNPNLNSSSMGGKPLQNQVNTVNGSKDVTWLRRTEYLAAEQAKSRVEARKRPTIQIDTSKEAHVSRIESTFTKASTPLSKLRHPTKPHLRAIDSYQVLPDRDTWSTQYQVLKFVDWPGKVSKSGTTLEGQDLVNHHRKEGEGGKAIKDERIDCALFRPVMDANGDQRISLYLPTSDHLLEDSHLAPLDQQEHDEDEGEGGLFGVKETKEEKETRLEREISRRFNKRRRIGKFPRAKMQQEMNLLLEGKEDEDEISRLEEVESQRHSTSFKFSRDYEPMDQGREVGSQLILVLDDGVADADIVSKDESVSDPHSEDAQVNSDGTSSSQKGKERDIDGNGNGNGSFNVRRRETDPPQALAENKFRKSHELNNGVIGNSQHAAKSTSRKIAYFHPITMRFGLRIKRLRKHEINHGPGSNNPDFWDRISLSHRSLTEREAEKRANSKREVDEIDLDFIESEVEEDNQDQDAEGDEDQEQDADADVDGDADADGDADGDSDAEDGDGIGGDVNTSGIGKGKNLIIPKPIDGEDSRNGVSNGIRLGDTVTKSDVQAEEKTQEDQDGDADRNSDGDDKNQDATDDDDGGGDDDQDDDDDDDDMEDVESVDADEELAALAAEAGDAGDDISNQNGQVEGRSRRSRSGRKPRTEEDEGGRDQGGEEEGNEQRGEIEMKNEDEGEKDGEKKGVQDKDQDQDQGDKMDLDS